MKRFLDRSISSLLTAAILCLALLLPIGGAAEGIYEADTSSAYSTSVSSFISNQDKVPIDAAHFPDEAFRSYIQENFDTDGDFYFSDNEISEINIITVYDKNIKSLKGIAYFSELKRLGASINKVSEIDLSKNTKLGDLGIHTNQLTAIDLSNNPSLYHLTIYNNDLKSIDIRNNPILKDAVLYGTKTYIDNYIIYRYNGGDFHVDKDVQIITSDSSPTVPPASVVAQGTFGDNLTWTLDEKGLLTISGTGPMPNFDWPDASHPFYAIRNDVFAVVIETGITTIGDYSFTFMQNIVRADIPEGVTKIGEAAFYECEKLTDIVLPETVDTIGMDAFSNCLALGSINIPAGIKTIDHFAFRGCKTMKNLVFPPDTPTKELIRCYKGNTCDVYSFKLPASLETLGYYAFGLTGIGELLLHVSDDFVVPDNIQIIEEEAFAGINAICIRFIGSISIKSKAFADCRQLKYIAFTNFSGEDSDTDIADDAFDGCDGLIFFGTNSYLENGVEQYAIDHGIQYMRIEGEFGNG